MTEGKDYLVTIVKARLLARTGKIEQAKEILLKLLEDETLDIRRKLNVLGLLVNTGITTEEVVNILFRLLEDRRLSEEEQQMIIRKLIELKQTDRLREVLLKRLNNPEYTLSQRLSAIKALQLLLSKDEYIEFLKKQTLNLDGIDFINILNVATNMGYKGVILNVLKEEFNKSTSIPRVLKIAELIYLLEGPLTLGDILKQRFRTKPRDIATNISLLAYLYLWGKFSDILELVEEYLKSDEIGINDKFLLILMLAFLVSKDTARNLLNKLVTGLEKRDPLLSVLYWKLGKTYGLELDDLYSKYLSEISEVSAEKTVPFVKLLWNLILLWFLRDKSFPLEEIKIDTSYEGFDKLQEWLIEKQLLWQEEDMLPMSLTELSKLLSTTEVVIPELSLEPVEKEEGEGETAFFVKPEPESTTIQEQISEDITGVSQELAEKVEEITPEEEVKSEDTVQIQYESSLLEGAQSSAEKLEVSEAELEKQTEETISVMEGSISDTELLETSPEPGMEPIQVLTDAQTAAVEEVGDTIQVSGELKELQELEEPTSSVIPGHESEPESAVNEVESVVREIEEIEKDLVDLLEPSSTELFSQKDESQEEFSEETTHELEAEKDMVREKAEKESRELTSYLEEIKQHMLNFENHLARRKFEEVLRMEVETDEGFKVMLDIAELMIRYDMFLIEDFQYIVKSILSMKYDIALLERAGKIFKRLGFDIELSENLVRYITDKGNEITKRAKCMLLYYKLFPEEAKSLYLSSIEDQVDVSELIEITDWLLLDSKFREEWYELLKDIISIQKVPFEVKMELLKFSRKLLSKEDMLNITRDMLSVIPPERSTELLDFLAQLES